MNLSGSQKYNYQQIRKGVDDAVVDKEFSNKLYRSTDGVLKVINTIVQTKGEGWAVQVLDEQGKPMFTKQEQEQFTDAFQDYIDPILSFFGEKREQTGGADAVDAVDTVDAVDAVDTVDAVDAVNKSNTVNATRPANETNTISNTNVKNSKNVKNATKNNNKNIGKNNKKNAKNASSSYGPTATELSGMSEEFLETKLKQATHQEDADAEAEAEEDHPTGIDDLYTAFVNRIRNADQVVNDYASKHGILKLEKERDLQPDIRLIPEPLALLISQGVTSASASVGFPISPTDTMDALAKIKVPFRTILFVVYAALDIARLSMALIGQEKGRKILSVLLAVLELLRGDWKKALLTIMGYYGMNPMLYGQIGKVFLMTFRMFSPDLQDQFIFGPLDASKSFVIGLLLSIFQVTAPEEIRLPLIAALEQIAQRKAEVDGVLESEKLSARPDYLSPTFEDLNNIQAVMSDPEYVCSCEFEELLKSVDQTAMIRTALQLLRIPVTKEFRKLKCGDQPCHTYVKEVVEEAVEEKEEESNKEVANQVATEEPVAKEEPVATEEPVVKEEPVATEEPVVKEEPVAKEEPVVKEEPAMEQTKNINQGINRVVNQISQKGGRILHIGRKNIWSRESGCFL
jgi:hypothetical protein